MFSNTTLCSLFVYLSCLSEKSTLKDEIPERILYVCFGKTLQCCGN